MSNRRIDDEKLDKISSTQKTERWSVMEENKKEKQYEEICKEIEKTLELLRKYENKNK